MSELPSWGLVELGDGERIISITCGGGGYGPPAERDPGRVRHDVIEGWISLERAERVYKVVLRADLTVDWEHTNAIRSNGFLSAPSASDRGEHET